MTPARERLSSADAAWLHMDRPTNLMVINALLVLDEPLEYRRLLALVRRRLLAPYPRFHQRVVEGRGLRGPVWEDDASFELARHVHRLGLPAPGDEAGLRELVGDLMSTPLDHEKPLWEMYLLDGYGEGCALVVRMHHCIADGIALARVMLSLTDSAPRTSRAPAAPELSVATPERGLLAGLLGSAGDLLAPAGALVAPAGGAVAATRAATSAVLHEGGDLLLHPRHVADIANELARDGEALAGLLFAAPDARTALKGNPSASRCVAWSRPQSLATIKQIAHTQHATVNDVLLSAVSGALRRYLSDRAGHPREIHALVPVNLRPLDEPLPRSLGNRFGLVLLALPLDVASRRRRLLEVKRRMDAIKSSRQAPVSYAVLSAGGVMPAGVESRIVDFFSAKATAVMTNVPGPREPVYLAGAPVGKVLVWAPASGSVGMSVSIFSYRGEITVGLMVDAQLVERPQTIVDHLERELVALEKLGPPRARMPAA
jgi:WS/DGAT/MGAT family acyltransferase